MKDREKFTFFWGGPFSQWYLAPFNLEGQFYNTAEQYMMAEKARLFKDTECRQAILEARKPDQQKRLGRLVKGFDQAVWDVQARNIVYRGNRAKFTTHRDLLQLLLDTEGTTLAEASPLDIVWGIGLAAITPTGHQAVVHLTLTDDHPWAQAFVVIEARPLTPHTQPA